MSMLIVMVIVIVALAAAPAIVAASLQSVLSGGYPPWVWPVAAVVMLSAIVAGGSKR